MQLPWRIYLKESSVTERRNEELKDMFVEAQHFCYNNGKNLFSNVVKVTIERSCLKSLSLTITLWLRATLFQWLQIRIGFLTCSYTPLCPTWLSGCLPNWDNKSPSAAFSRRLQDWQEAHLRASGEVRRAFAKGSLLLGCSSSCSSFLHPEDLWPPQGRRLSCQ